MRTAEEYRDRLAAILVDHGGDTIPRSEILALVETSDFDPAPREEGPDACPMCGSPGYLVPGRGTNPDAFIPDDR